MSSKHIIKEQDVAGLPLEHLPLREVGSPYLIHDLRLDRRTVPVISVVRQVFFRKVLKHLPPVVGFQSRYMKKSHVVKPRLRAGRVMRHHGAALPCPQTVLGKPFVVNEAASTVPLNFQRVFCLKSFLPGESNTTAKITHI